MIALPINLSKNRYMLIDEKKPSKIKTRLVDLTKKTVSATKERAKVRGVTAVELAAGGLVTKTAATAVAAAGATGIALTAAPWIAGFAAAALAGGIIKTVTENENS